MLTGAFGAPPDRPWWIWPVGAAGNPAPLAELIGGLRQDHAVHVSGGRAALALERLPRWIDRSRSGGSTA